jgi:signal peptidase I
VPKRGGKRGGMRGLSPRRWWGLAVVHGRSMQPTLYAGDRLLVRYGAAPRPGQIAVVRLPGPGLSVKRIGWAEAGGWWIERDNRAEGVDSWQVGPVLADAVVAVALLRVWPRPRLLTGSRRGRQGGRERPAAPQ